MSTEKPTSPPEAEREPLSGNLRSILSLLIILHLFALFVAVSTNGVTSGVMRRLWRTPMKPYLQALTMDLNYRFQLTDGGAAPTGGMVNDWFVVADVKLKSGGARTLKIPDTQPRSRLSQQRYIRLASLLFIENEQFGNTRGRGIAAQAIASGLLSELQQQGLPLSEVERMTMRLKGRIQPVPGNFREGLDPHRSEVYRDYFVAQVVPNVDGTASEPIVVPVSSQNQSAPAAR